MTIEEVFMHILIESEIKNAKDDWLNVKHEYKQIDCLVCAWESEEKKLSSNNNNKWLYFGRDNGKM